MTAKSNQTRPDDGLRPALFDLQVNGFAGVDFQQDDLTTAALRQALDGLRRHHLHRFFPTLITTDTMAAAGAPPGRYTLGAQAGEVGPDGVAREPGKSNFAASALIPDRDVANAARWLGLTPDAAWALVSTAVAAHFAIELPLLPAFSHG